MEEEDVWHEWISWRDLWNLGCRDCLVKWCKMQIYRALCFLICTVMALAVPQRAGRIVGTDHRSSSHSEWWIFFLFPSVGQKRTAGTWKPLGQGTGLEDLFFWTYFQGFSPENLPGCKFRWSFWVILPFRWRSWGRPSIWFQKGRSVWQCWTLTTSAPASVGAWRRCWRIWSRKIMQAKMVKMTKQRRRRALSPNAAAHQHPFPHRWPLHHQWPVQHPVLQLQQLQQLQRKQGNLQWKRLLSLSRTRPRMMRSWGNSWMSATSGCERCNSSHKRMQSASFTSCSTALKVELWFERKKEASFHPIRSVCFCLLVLSLSAISACMCTSVHTYTYRHTDTHP